MTPMAALIRNFRYLFTQTILSDSGVLKSKRNEAKLAGRLDSEHSRHGQSMPENHLRPLSLREPVLGGATSHHKMENQGDYRKYQQKMYQSSGNMKHRKTTEPCDQQNNEQYRPDAHFILLRFLRCPSLPRYATNAATTFTVIRGVRRVITPHLVSARQLACTRRNGVVVFRRQPWPPFCT